jgi:hypothetical protein
VSSLEVRINLGRSSAFHKQLEAFGRAIDEIQMGTYHTINQTYYSEIIDFSPFPAWLRAACEIARDPCAFSDVTETRERLDFPNPAITLKNCPHQDEVHEQTGAKRDEQENTETTEPAICCHGVTKLPENRHSHRRFSYKMRVDECQK